jgi:hypothetical protein
LEDSNKFVERAGGMADGVEGSHYVVSTGEIS